MKLHDSELVLFVFLPFIFLCIKLRYVCASAVFHIFNAQGIFEMLSYYFLIICRI